MGAKQSKRSVDISGKEAESAGEVAAAMSGGEGRVEQLADADALKPQLNGDAHIHETEDKQKDIDSGTPENEKDATTEKETKQQEEAKESGPLTNGESEQKVENGESTPTPEDGKKPKKEKVKKKWSLRSISFSRKDKPKQEKKPKDEEPKTNGEPEKVPEETAEIASEVPVVTEAAKEETTPTEVKEDKTPETPVTEPITNGSSTPESPKVETPVVKEPAAPSSENEMAESKTEVEPEQLAVNGLSLEEPAKDTTEIVKNEDSKEAPTAETPEIVPEISVKNEVCVEQMPLIDSKPPPLPANPPPSSVASFAATTMAPELSDASLANTADNATLPPPSPPSDPIKKDKLVEIDSKPEINLTVAQTVSNELSSPVKQNCEVILDKAVENEVENNTKETIIFATGRIECNNIATVDNIKNGNEVVQDVIEENSIVSDNVSPQLISSPPEIDDEKSFNKSSQPEIPALQPELAKEPLSEKDLISNEKTLEHELEMPPPPPELIEETAVNMVSGYAELELVVCPVIESVTEKEVIDEIPKSDIPASLSLDESYTVENLPDPPPPIHDEIIKNSMETNSVPEKSEATIREEEVLTIVNTNNISDKMQIPKEVVHNNLDEDIDHNSIKKVKDSQENINEIIECNGNVQFVISDLTSTKESPELTPAANSNDIANVEIDVKFEISDLTSTKESPELTPAANSNDIANVEIDRTATSPEESMPESPETQSAGDSDEPLPPPPSELSGPDTPQRALPVSDKLADLIPELPEVPELKTETLQVTTSDAGAAN